MNILVISPHADDETLGAGGTLLKYKEQGNKIYWLNAADMKEEYGYSCEKVSERKKEMENVRKAYRFDGFYNLGLAPARLDKYEMSFLVGEISKVIAEVKPDTVILPYQNDVHSDHKAVFGAAYSCTKNFRFPYIKKIMCMEILSETDFAVSDDGFIPNYFVDITEFIEEKIKIMKCYKSEIKAVPFPRSENAIRGLAQYRGAAAGAKFAEGFRIIKIIE